MTREGEHAGQADVFTPKVPFTRLATVNGTTAQAVAMTRSADGNLHLVFQTLRRQFPDRPGDAVDQRRRARRERRSLRSRAGRPASPGSSALPDGTLEAVFGAISPSNVSSLWGITSSDGGASWSAPAIVKGGGSLEALVYGSDVTAAVSSGTPVLTLPQAGQLVIQRGLGAGSPSYQLTNSADGSTTDAEVATDAATGEVVAAWPSIAGNPTLYVQGASPSIQGAAEPCPARAATRRSSPAATRPRRLRRVHDGRQARAPAPLRRRHGRGRLGQDRRPRTLGVATSLDGRIWVMWGDDSGGGVAVTRSNKAVTRFEPIQHLKLNSAVDVPHLGRRTPRAARPARRPDPEREHRFSRRACSTRRYARGALGGASRVKPIKNKKLAVIGHTLTVTVSDAGDPVAGANVSAGTVVHKTNGQGGRPVSSSAPR